ncbi:MAG: 5-aminolevulinate synthase [Alphaproteobacteria bacterium]
MIDYQGYFEGKLQEIKAEGRYRYFAHLERPRGNFPEAIMHKNAAEHPITIWCSNDYLGMGQHRDVINAMTQALQQYGAGAGGTRNISGTHILHQKLENALAEFHHQEAALLFSSGYVANQTSLATLGAILPNCIIYSDAHNHASIIEGIKQSKAEKYIFRHNDLLHLEELLRQSDPERPKIIVFESVYSMEGDIAPIADIISLAKQYGALTYLDEVHAVGLYGDTGAGVAEQLGVMKEIDIIEGTLGKAFGLMGGYIAGSATLIDVVRSFGSGFIFTTALPPVLLAGGLAALDLIKKFHKERAFQQQQAELLRQKLTAAKIPILKNNTHIVPIMVGNADICWKMAQHLLEKHHIYIQPINYPTVPRGTERLRVSVTPHHTVQHVEKLVEALISVFNECISENTITIEGNKAA